MSAGDVVAEVMTAPNRQDSRAVRPAAGDRRAGDGEDEQEHMQPLPVLEFLRRLPDRFHLPDILQVFTWLESNGTTWRNAHFFSGSRVAADTTLSRLHLEYPEPAKLDALASLHGGPHRVEHRIDSHPGFDLGDVGDLRQFVHDVDLDHA